jgi:hypothetical protein
MWHTDMRIVAEFSILHPVGNRKQAENFFLWKRPYSWMLKCIYLLPVVDCYAYVVYFYIVVYKTEIFTVVTYITVSTTAQPRKATALKKSECGSTNDTKLNSAHEF